MSEFKVVWKKPDGDGDGTISLNTKRAAIMLVTAFYEEGRTATAYERNSDDWAEIPFFPIGSVR